MTVCHKAFGRAGIAGMVCLLISLSPVAAGAQTIGTFSWKLDPFCDVVTFTVTADGPAFRLSGFDQPCGGARVPAAGIVVPNPDGTFTLAFYLVTVQGLSSHTTATLMPGTYSGPWRDASGQAGTLSFGPGSGSGTPRPVAALQQRVAGACTGSEFVQKVREDGSVECAAAPAGNSGDITSVTAGAGLSGGGGAGEVTLAIATGGVGSTQIADGSIGAVDVDASQIQRRVSTVCPVGYYFAGIDAAGVAACSTGGSAGSTGLGHWALRDNTASSNTAVGYFALRDTTTGFANTAVGRNGLVSNTEGHANTAVGSQAMTFNTVGDENTAVGAWALEENTIGEGNTAVGVSALKRMTTGSRNVAIGSAALSVNTTGSDNVAVGVTALSQSGNSSFNTAVGTASLVRSSGQYNTATGWHSGHALTSGIENTVIGYSALPDATTGSRNIAIGVLAGGSITAGNDNIHIGNRIGVNESGTIRIGAAAQVRTYISGILNRTTGNPNAIPVLIDSAGQLGTISSSRRTKEDIHDMGRASAGLFRLRPVTFRYLQPYADGSRPIDYGLIAEEVDEVYPDLVVRNDAGEVQTVQYHKLTPMLLNELQRLRLEFDAQQTLIQSLLARINELERPRR